MRRVAVVADGELHVEGALGSLAAAGLKGIVAPTTEEARRLIESGVLAMVVGVAGAGWTAERARPVATMAPVLRRGCVVVLVGAHLVTGDGAVAFALGVDLVVRAGDLARLGDLVSGALLAKRTLVAPLDCAAATRLGG